MRVWPLIVGVMLAAPILGAPRDVEVAERFFQRGWNAEMMSDEAYASFLRTLRSPFLDAWTNRWVYAVDNYSNAVRYNPAHWRAHRQLGFLYMKGEGTHANDELALLHLVAYLSLRPNDFDSLEAKARADTLLRRFVARVQSGLRAASGAVNEALENPETEAFVRGLLAQGQMATQPRLGPLAATAVGSPGDFQQVAKVRLAQHEAVEGLFLSRAETAGVILDSPDLARLELAVVRSAMYVSDGLFLAGAMHRFTRYLDERRIPCDRRLPEGLIGESVALLRNFFTRGRVASQFRLQEEYQRYAALGGGGDLGQQLRTLRASDLWTPMDYSKPLPSAFIAAGTIEEPERNAQVYDVLRAASVLALPDYDKDAEGQENELRLAAADVVATEARKAWLGWRNVHLAECAAAYGLKTVDQVFVRDYVRLGSGEAARWPYGPLAAPSAPQVGGLPAETGWLYAAR